MHVRAYILHRVSNCKCTIVLTNFEFNSVFPLSIFNTAGQLLCHTLHVDIEEALAKLYKDTFFVLRYFLVIQLKEQLKKSSLWPSLIQHIHVNYIIVLCHDTSCIHSYPTGYSFHIFFLLVVYSNCRKYSTLPSGTD